MPRKHLLLTTMTAVLVTAVPAAAQAHPIGPDAISDAERRVSSAVPQAVMPVDAPARLSDGIIAQTPAGELTVTAVGAADSPVRRTAAGRAVYAATYDSTTTVYQREDAHSARIVNLLASAQAPQAYHWDFEISGATTILVPRPDGSVSIVRQDTGGTSTIAGTVAPAWAIAADNTPVLTHYGVSGARLTQVVVHGPTTAYPVTADPRWAWG